MDCTQHRGHRRFVGGPMDGQIDHLIYAHSSDFWLTLILPSRGRAMYERDLDGGTEVTYRFVGYAK